LSGLYELDLESKNVRRFGPALPVPVAGEGVEPSLTVKPDGSVLVSVRDGSLYRVFRVDRGAVEAQPALMFPQQPRIDASRDGALYLSLEHRPVEIVRLGASKGSVERLAAGPSITPTAIVPLADGRILIASSAGNRSRILVVSPDREPTPLVETEEDTRPPMTAVGDRHAAVIIGSGTTSDIAIVVADSGRIIERFPAPPRVSSLAASPDGKTLYVVAAGSISAVPRGGGTPRTIGTGDSVTVDPQSGDLIAKLDGQERLTLMRIPAAGGAAQPIPFQGDFGMINKVLMPGAVRNNQLVLPLSSVDSWDWYAGVVDLQSGKVTRLAADYSTDFHYVTREADGTPVATGLGFKRRSGSSRWRQHQIDRRNDSARERGYLPLFGERHRTGTVPAGQSHVYRVVEGIVDRHRHEPVAVELPPEGHAARQTVRWTFDVALQEENAVGIQATDEAPRRLRCEDRDGGRKVAELGGGTLRNREDERSRQPAPALTRIRGAYRDLPAVDDSHRAAPCAGHAGDHMDGLRARVVNVLRVDDGSADGAPSPRRRS